MFTMILRIKFVLVILILRSKADFKKMLTELTLQKLFKKTIGLVTATVALLFAFGVIEADMKDTIVSVLALVTAMLAFMD